MTENSCVDIAGVTDSNPAPPTVLDHKRLERKRKRP
jgi:hypothetical protein